MSSLEDLFSKIAMNTVNTVSRIAISHATNAAIRGVTTYIKQKPKDPSESRELQSLQRQFDLKIKNLKPTIDIIAHSVADGNHDLEPALELCNDLKREIDDFTNELDDTKATNTPEYIKRRLKALLQYIDDTVPSLHLALRNLPEKTSVSPSRLLQASAILTSSSKTTKAATPFVLRLYSLFAAGAGHVLSWKEEFAKCTLVLPQEDEFHHALEITENLDDGRFHEVDEKPRILSMDLEYLKRMYYTRSGTLLNLEDSKEPVLVLKVLKQQPTMKNEQPLSPSISQIRAKEVDPEIEREELSEADWYALEIWKDNNSDDSEEEEEEEAKENRDNGNQKSKEGSKSLLLLEAVIRLSLLEVTEKINHLEASDDLIRLYMSE